jgi:hypothetical protein
MAQTTVGTVGQNYTIIGAKTNINTSNVDINTAGGTVGIKANTTTIQGGNLIVTGNSTKLSTDYTTVKVNGFNGEFKTEGYNTNINTTYTTIGSAQTFITGTKVELGSSAANATTNIKSVANFEKGADMKGNTITNVKAGVNAADAVNKSQLDEARKDAISISTAYTDNAAKLLDSKIEKVDQKVEALRLDLGNETARAIGAEKAITNEMRGLGAISAAMSAAQGSQLYNPTKKGNISIGTGYYNGATAVSAGASYFTSPNTKINANVATGTYTKLAVGVGVSLGF